MLFRFLIAVSLLATPAGAQGVQLPEGWRAILDVDQRAVVGDGVESGEWRYTPMPPGWHVTTTESGVSLFPDGERLQGRWGIELELFLFSDPSNEGIGIVVADEVSDETQLRFMMRANGEAGLVVSTAAGDRMVTEPWSSDSSLVPHPEGSITKYLFRLVHESERLIFSINGNELFTTATPGEDHEVIPGIRIGSGLNVHVSRFDLIRPLAPPRAR